MGKAGGDGGQDVAGESRKTCKSGIVQSFHPCYIVRPFAHRHAGAHESYLSYKCGISYMTKEMILHHVIRQLSENLILLSEAAKTAHAASIHEENLPDNEYDTLGLEASYLAQAQANRAQEIKAALASYKGLVLRSFTDDSPIRLTALVTLEAEEDTRKVFIGPEAGGMKIKENGDEVLIITPHSPVGQELLGKTCGELVNLRGGNADKAYEIVAVC
jgi:transcription elongation GreA/GreB family factor